MGLQLLLEHPHTPSCADCKKWMHKDGILQKHHGRPLHRPSGAPLPCHKCPKSPDGTPNPTADLKGRGLAAYELYLLVRAGLPMPEDAIVRRNCILIQRVLDHIQSRRADWTPLLALLMCGSRK